MSDVITDLRAKQAVKIAVARALLNAAAEAGRDLSEDEDKQYKAVTAEVDALDSMIVREQQVAEREAQLNMPTRSAVKPEAAMVNSKTKPGDSEEKALAYFVRTGDRSAITTRASNDTGMNITTAADGGRAVPTGHYNQIVARRDEMMLAKKLGVRQIVGVGTTVNVPLDAEDDGEFVTKSEMGDDNTTNAFDRDAPALGTVAMTLVKYTKKIELTDELLADEDSNLLSFISDFVGRGMAKTHNSLLLTEALAGGTAALTLDAAAAIGAGEIPEFYYKLADEYAEGDVAWIMRRATEGYIRGLVSTSMFLFDVTPGGSTPARSLWGAPIYNSAYAGALAASGKSLVFGNWYYMGLREQPGLTVLRDPYTVDGKVILKYYFRAVYKTLQAEAILYATHPSA
jgi:HK97 family phage major capsid protein